MGLSNIFNLLDTKYVTDKGSMTEGLSLFYFSLAILALAVAITAYAMTRSQSKARR